MTTKNDQHDHMEDNKTDKGSPDKPRGLSI